MSNAELKINKNIILNGGGVDVRGTTGCFELAGGTIQKGMADKSGNSVTVANGGMIKISEGIVKESLNYGIVIWDGTLIVTGGSIRDNLDGGVLLKGSDSIFMMDGGSISSNNSAGVLMYGGKFTMSGGTIDSNSKKNAQGGVLIYGSSSKFAMSSGTICNNKKAGLQLVEGVFEMNGGAIQENVSDTSGGVRIGKNANAIFNKGMISNNHSDMQGGGIGFEKLSKDQVIASDMSFSGNTSSKSYLPPIDVETLFPKILSRSSSLPMYAHPLNGFDIGYIASDPQLVKVQMSKNIDHAGSININQQPYSESVLMGINTRTKIEAIPKKG